MLVLCEDEDVASTSENFIIVNEGFRARLVGLSDAQLSAETPCEGWTTLDCIDHVIEIYAQVASAVAPEIRDLDGATPLERFDHLAPVIEAATKSPELGATIVQSPFGPLALKQLISSVVLHDTLVHTWDIAMATGGDLTLNAQMVERAFAKMAPLDDGLRGESTFAAKIEPPPGADLQTQFLCFLGRKVPQP